MTRQLLLIIALVFTTGLTAQERSCSTTELHEQRMENDPVYQKNYLDRQEKFRKLTKERVGVSRAELCPDPVLVPMAVHYADAPNNFDLQCLTDLALDQIQILNDDYQGLNADIVNWTNGTSSNYPGVENAESCIEFCLATMNHPAGSGIAEGDHAVTVNVYGSSSAPAWSGYLNVFVRNIGALGFSPLGGNGNGDGVTCDNSAFGAGAGCTGFVPGAPYNLGRTLTHELGHYLNLAHIWGGGCGNDDGIADTPDQQTSNGGCPGNNAISCGSLDLHMNYMDYTNDACMYMFSAGQQAVMENYLAANLQNVTSNSAVCVPPTPTVAFVQTQTTVSEGTSSCATDGEQQVTIEVGISASPSSTAFVTLLANGTATNGVDYTYSPATLTFPAGQTSNQTITVTIFEDGQVENDESISFSFLVNANGGDAAPGTENQSHEIAILNDDQAPSAGSQNVFLIDQNFDDGIAPFVATDGGDPGNTWYQDGVGSTLNGTPQAIANSDAAGNGSSSNEVLTTPVFNGSSVTNLTLEFDQYARVYSGNGDFNETFRTEIYDGNSWQTVYLRTEAQGSIGDWGNPNHQTINLSAYAAPNNQLRFTYIAEWDYWWAIDNVQVSGLQNVGVQTDANGGSGFSERDFGPNSTLYFYDENSGDVMLSLINTSGFNYGCTSVYVETGSSILPGAFQSNAPESDWITEKTFRVEPENNNPNGSFTISLYYTQEEIIGWSQTSGEPVGNLQMVKAAGSVSSATSLETAPVSTFSFGSDWVYSAQYSSGFSGFALGGAAPVLPVEWLAVNAKAGQKAIDVNWSTATESGNRGFEVLRSEDASKGFSSLGFVAGAGSSTNRQDYSFVDNRALAGITYYYQIRQIDFDGSTSLSPLVNAKIESETLSLRIYPNPVREQLNVELFAPLSGSYELVHVSGLQIASGDFPAGGQRIKLNTSQLSTGIYYLVVSTGEDRRVKKVIVD
ncbi:hypothetical protein CEQ90_12475 [Lewinellaceae bacterium SD302]|nr:hypothetical protein CEQ90_12475 [Lewinellaceae bacterium SD302]